MVAMATPVVPWTGTANIISPILHLRTEGPYLTAYFTSQGTTDTTSLPQSFILGYATPPPPLYFLNRVVADSDDFDANADENEVRMEVSSIFWGGEGMSLEQLLSVIAMMAPMIF